MTILECSVGTTSTCFVVCVPGSGSAGLQLALAFQLSLSKGARDAGRGWVLRALWELQVRPALQMVCLTQSCVTELRVVPGRGRNGVLSDAVRSSCCVWDAAGHCAA